MSADSEWESFEDGRFYAEFYIENYGLARAERFIARKNKRSAFVRGFDSYLAEYKEKRF